MRITSSLKIKLPSPVVGNIIYIMLPSGQNNFKLIAKNDDVNVHLNNVKGAGKYIDVSAGTSDEGTLVKCICVRRSLPIPLTG